MAARTRQSEGRTHALSKERIVAAAIKILDAEGIDALTFRALAARLRTGSGAIYWHIADKDNLLAAATDHVVAQAMATIAEGLEPQEAIRGLALGVFDALDIHPWVGGRLSRDPLQYAVLRILEGIGRHVQVLGVPEHAQFNSATTLLSFILGLAGQYAAAARLVPQEADRTAFLGAVAARWTQLSPAQHPFVRQAARHLPEHDDREQFLAGVNLILAGIADVR